jgi:MYXO-CTERM domain-containing protein/uncharacterized delta-60 repeat protein
MLATAVLYDETDTLLGRPYLTSLTPNMALETGSVFTVGGWYLRGLSEASGGNSRSSPTDFPLLTLVDIARDQWRTLPSQDFSGNHVTARVPNVPPGHYRVLVTANGITSDMALQVLRDVTPPDTLLSGDVPNTNTHQTHATFVLSSDDAGASFECSLDDAAFTPCTSPVSFSGLSEGWYDFSVRARDAAGSVDATPARHRWYVDLTPPETVILTYPARFTNQRTARFTFSSGGVSSLCECSLDGAPFTSCYPPASYNNLAEGTHTFQVYGRDSAGNVDPTPASHTWTVDIVAPLPPVITSPAGGATLDTHTPTFLGTTEPDTSVTVILNGKVGHANPLSSTGTWTYKHEFPSLADGQYTVTVTATDRAGNSADSAPVSFTIDATPDTPEEPTPEEPTPEEPTPEEPTPEEPTPPAEGCGCTAGPANTSWLLAGLALLAGVVSRRRQTSTAIPTRRLMTALALVLTACTPGREHAPKDATVTEALEQPALLAATPGWSTAAPMGTARFWHTSTLLPTGKVLVVGGAGPSGQALASAELYDPVTGTWSPTGSLTQVRSSHTATLLPSGKVLVVGGFFQNGIRLASAELYDPATGTWSSTGSLVQERDFHTATLLRNGKVLVAGGYGPSGYNRGAELYDPATGTWSSTGSLAEARSNHAATLLRDGKVLVVGGLSTVSSLTSAELYDPATGTWSSTGSLTESRDEPTATLLHSDKVLVAGGSNKASAELYDPVTGTWSPTGSLAAKRDSHTATLLPSGKVLVTGGYEWVDSQPVGLTRTEVYDPVTGTWSSAGTLAKGGNRQTATLLPSGKVLVAGGYVNSSGGYAHAELHDPAAGTWTSMASLTQSRTSHTATLLPDGKVLVAGGQGSDTLASAELYDPVINSWSSTGSLSKLRSGHMATLLPDGKVLVLGGNPNLYAELYDPATGTWSSSGSRPPNRGGYTATLLPNGKVLVAGGGDAYGLSASAELYDPATDTWSPTGSLAQPRSGHTATLLPDGKVLVAGGAGRRDYYVDYTELYDPATGSWSRTGMLSQGRMRHTATLLPDGKVLVIGGETLRAGVISYLASAEMYNPTTGTWSSIASLPYPRGRHTATLLPMGKVLVAGGVGDDSTGFNANAAVYDPGTRSWSFNASLAQGRRDHTATLLPDGRVLVVGGSHGNIYASAEAYDDTGSDIAYRPSLTSLAPSTPMGPGSLFTVGGEYLRGFSEASGGNSRSSATDFPLLTLLDLARERLIPLPSRDFSSNHVTAQVPKVFPGQYLLNVTVNGLTSGKVLHVLASSPPVITSPANGATLEDNTPTFSGTAAPDSTVSLSLDGAVIGTATTDATGSWSFTPTLALADGPHTVTATASDTNGTSAASAPVSFTVDTTPEEPMPPAEGCGCAAGPGDASWLLGGLALLAGVVSRRRQRGI